MRESYPFEVAAFSWSSRYARSVNTKVEKLPAKELPFGPVANLLPETEI
jgi:hypothetical protein